jgi:hypothetical protein
LCANTSRRVCLGARAATLTSVTAASFALLTARAPRTLRGRRRWWTAGCGAAIPPAIPMEVTELRGWKSSADPPLTRLHRSFESRVFVR